MHPVSPNIAIAPVGLYPRAATAISAPLQEIPKTSASSEGFATLVQNYLKHVNADQQSADRAIADFVTGKTDNIQQVVMAVVQADLSFQFFMEIRNKLIESYHELMRMQF